MKETWKKGAVSVCVLLAAGVLFTGCSTLNVVQQIPGEDVYVVITDVEPVKCFVARGVTLEMKDMVGTAQAKALASGIGGQLQAALQTRGHRVQAYRPGAAASGGALVAASVSVQEIRPFGPSFEFRAYVVTAIVQVSARGRAIRNQFVVDGRKLGQKTYCVTENAALSLVQAEMSKEIDEWLACVLKSCQHAAHRS